MDAQDLGLFDIIETAPANEKESSTMRHRIFFTLSDPHQINVMNRFPTMNSEILSEMTFNDDIV
jgi:hypothetical protein